MPVRSTSALRIALAVFGWCAASLSAEPSWAMAPVRHGPPGIIIANDGLACAGTLLELGDTQERVLRLCGTPTSASHAVLQARGKTTMVDLWRYERYGSFPRLLRFQNGILFSLVASSPR